MKTYLSPARILFLMSLIFGLAACGGGGGGGSAPADTTAPVITLNGVNPVTFIQGEAYTEAGATASDDRNSSVSVSIGGTVNTSTVGSYTVTYTATDSANNTSTATRTVNVELPTDITAPVISLNALILSH